MVRVVVMLAVLGIAAMGWVGPNPAQAGAVLLLAKGGEGQGQPKIIRDPVTGQVIIQGKMGSQDSNSTQGQGGEGQGQQNQNQHQNQNQYQNQNQ